MTGKGRAIEDVRGFSLVELLVLLGILAVLFMISIPLLQGYASNRSLKSAARELMGDIAIYKERTIAENRKHRITVDAGSNSYTIERCTTQGSSCTTYAVLQPAKYLTAFGGDIDITSANGPYVCQTRGTVTNGTIIIQNGRPSTATIRINMTGRTSVQFVMQ